MNLADGGTIVDLVEAESVAKGLGKSAAVIFLKTPGFTSFEATKAARPVTTLAGLASPMAQTYGAQYREEPEESEAERPMDELHVISPKISMVFWRGQDFNWRYSVLW